MKVVTLLSGGLDSTTLLYHAVQRMCDGDASQVHALSFSYGQRHMKELEVAFEIAGELKVKQDEIVLAVAGYEGPDEPLAAVLTGSALTDDSVPVPEGHYAAESMKATVVPNRNAIMLSIAYGVAVAEGAELVAFAAHSGDHAIYPDCRPEFVHSLDFALKSGNAWDDSTKTPTIIAPFIYFSKTSIAKTAFDLNVPIERTWSCYRGESIHCGRCGTCVERREAIEGAIDEIAFERDGMRSNDPTEYEDRDFWTTVKP